MSVDESVESTEFRTPCTDPSEEELHPPCKEPPTGDIGASPVLVGPVTRSGRKRKNIAPVRSTGKKKNKMIPKSPPPSTTPAQACNSSAHHPPTAPESQPGDCLSPAATGQIAPGPAAPVAPGGAGVRQNQQDLAALLTSGLVDIKRSMAGMETRIKDQISGLEQAVNKISSRSLRSQTL